MSAHTDNVVAFPGQHCRTVRGCPHCGTQTDFWRFGRLLWAYCDTHQVRWVAADLGSAPRVADYRALRRNLEFLAAFDEIGTRNR